MNKIEANGLVDLNNYEVKSLVPNFETGSLEIWFQDGSSLEVENFFTDENLFSEDPPEVQTVESSFFPYSFDPAQHLEHTLVSPINESDGGDLLGSESLLEKQSSLNLLGNESAAKHFLSVYGQSESEPSPSINVAPSALNDSFTMLEDSLGTMSVLSNDSDPDGDVLTVVDAVALNGTVDINPDQTLTYTPNTNFNGVDTVTYTITDGNGGYDTAIVNVDITPVDDPSVVSGDITGAVTEDVLVDASGSVSISDPDVGDNPSFADTTISSFYGDLTLVNGDWTYVLNQTNVQDLNAGDVVTDVMTLTATDGTTQDITVEITGTDDAAVVTGDFTGAVVEDGVGTATGAIAITDADSADTPSFAGAAGTYGNVSISGTTWTYTLTQSSVQHLNAGEVITDTVTLTATDGTTQDITVEITGTEDAAVVTGDFTGAVIEDGVGTATGAIAITDVDSADTPSFAGAAGTYGNVTISGTTWTYTLNQASVQHLNEAEVITDTVTLTATDGTTQAITVTITGENDAPNAVDDTAGVALPTDSEVDIDVLANDTDVESNTLEVINIGDPTYGTASLNLDGTIKYVPNVGFQGVDTFTYEISDGNGGVSTATVTVDVDINEAPVVDTEILDQTGDLLDTGILLDISNNFSDPDGDALIYTATGLPLGLILDANTGEITGSLDTGSCEINHITVTATDPSGASVSDTFDWTVNGGVVGEDLTFTSAVTHSGTNCDDAYHVENTGTGSISNSEISALGGNDSFEIELLNNYDTNISMSRNNNNLFQSNEGNDVFNIKLENNFNEEDPTLQEFSNLNNTFISGVGDDIFNVELSLIENEGVYELLKFFDNNNYSSFLGNDGEDVFNVNMILEGNSNVELVGNNSLSYFNGNFGDDLFNVNLVEDNNASEDRSNNSYNQFFGVHGNDTFDIAIIEKYGNVEDSINNNSHNTFDGGLGHDSFTVNLYHDEYISNGSGGYRNENNHSNNFLGFDGNDTFEVTYLYDNLFANRFDGGAGDDTFIINGDMNEITGGAGSDTFTVGGDSSSTVVLTDDYTVTGTGDGVGSDNIFIWNVGDGSSSVVPIDTFTNFTLGIAGGSILDLSDLLQGEDYSNLDDYITVAFDDTNSNGLIDSGETVTMNIFSYGDGVHDQTIVFTGLITAVPTADFVDSLINGAQLVIDGNETPVLDSVIVDQTGDLNDTGILLDISSSFSDPDGDALIYTATGLPPGLVLDANTGEITGSLDTGSCETHHITVTATDPFGVSVSNTFDWTVNGGLVGEDLDFDDNFTHIGTNCDDVYGIFAEDTDLSDSEITSLAGNDHFDIILRNRVDDPLPQQGINSDNSFYSGEGDDEFLVSLENRGNTSFQLSSGRLNSLNLFNSGSGDDSLTLLFILEDNLGLDNNDDFGSKLEFFSNNNENIFIAEDGNDFFDIQFQLNNNKSSVLERNNNGNVLNGGEGNDEFLIRLELSSNDSVSTLNDNNSLNMFDGDEGDDLFNISMDNSNGLYQEVGGGSKDLDNNSYNTFSGGNGLDTFDIAIFSAFANLQESLNNNSNNTFDGGSEADSFTVNLYHDEYVLDGLDEYRNMNNHSNEFLGGEGDDTFDVTYYYDNLFANTFDGGAGDDTFVINGDMNEIIGGAGSDTFTVGGDSSASETIAGFNVTGTGDGVGENNTFIWNAGDGNSSIVPIDTFTNFTVGAGGSVLDLSGLLQGENSTNLDDYFNVNFDDTNTNGLIDSGETVTMDIFSSGDGVHDQTIVFSGLDMDTPSADFVDSLINSGQLVVDF